MSTVEDGLEPPMVCQDAPLMAPDDLPAFARAGVTERYLGVWRRRLLIDAEGRRETTGERIWLQTGVWHADLYIPGERPTFDDASDLQQCSDEQLYWLCRQQGFAGITRLHGELCYWDRQWDSSQRAQLDVGRMRFEPHCVHETGVLSPLYERWERLPASQSGSHFMLDGAGPGAEGTPTKLLVAGHYFMLVRMPRAAPEILAAARRAVEAGVASREALLALADLEMSFGEIEHGHWRIRHSTLPWREGHPPFAEKRGAGNPTI